MTRVIARGAVDERWGFEMNGCIVVGTDGSATAKKAVKAAVDMAQVFGQRLHIVSAYKPLHVSVHLPEEMSGAIGPHSHVDAVLAEAAALCRVAGVDVKTHPRVGEPADAILEVADEEAADLIVVGSKGIDSKSRFLVGNVPSRVVHHASCSTFVVRTS